MIEVPTVLVLGAGASKDYDYPTGLELRDTILDALASSGTPMHERLKFHGYDDSRIKVFRKEFADSQLPTIDQFLEKHSDFGSIGKLAIACALLPREQHWKLERRADRPTWYDRLWDELRRDIENFTDNKLTIVTFNYDRSLEQYLGRALQVAKTRNIGECLSSLGFIHVYGILGGKPYIDQLPREYGNIEDPSLLRKAANSIKIIDREDDPELLSQFELAKNALANAERVVILGFGYEEKNVERLGLRESVRGRAVGVLGTVWKMPKKERERVERVVGLAHQLTLVDANCLGIFDDHFSFE